MLFIKPDDLKMGMRLAKPIYNKKGVLLYERNSKLTQQGIEAVKNFGLIGIYILEPAEPLPPMTQDDTEFERFQTMYVFSIQEELQAILQKLRYQKLPTIADAIIRGYGRMDHKINFVQNLRTNEDYVYKHSLNVAILCALMSHQLNMRREEQSDTIVAAILHDIGKLNIPISILKKYKNINEIEMNQMRHCEYKGIELIEQVCRSYSLSVSRIVKQAYVQRENFHNAKEHDIGKVVLGAKILIVAELFDTMTAMNHSEEPASEIAALRYLMRNAALYDDKVVKALVKSINFLNEGCCVELSNGEKGLVLAANEADILKPMLLLFKNNVVIDLRQQLIYDDLEIKDIMKTLDNRYVMNVDAAKQFGFSSNSDAKSVAVPRDAGA